MICWAETTLPSSRVRSEALSTYLFSRSFLGRRVIGTVSGGLGFVALALEGLVEGGASDAGVVAGAEGVTREGSVVLAPAGLLAAAAIRAARALASRLFFIRGT